MKTINITRTVFKVSDFISWQKNRTLILSPSFQRRPVWKGGAKAYLIDTVVRGLPMPVIFLRELRTDLKTLEPIREVVDGQQRIRTLITYIQPELLKDYDEKNDSFSITKTINRDLAGCGFKDLLPDIQSRILDYQFSVHILPTDFDDREILQIFARMNATGVKLNDQELRNAEYYGVFKTLMYSLATEQLERWRTWGIFTEYNIARMEEVELTSEFAIMMLKGIQGKSQKSITQTYKAWEDEFPQKKEIETRFRQICESIDDELGKDIGLSPFRKKTLFYSLFCAFYEFQYGIGSKLEKTTARPIMKKTLKGIKVASDKIANNGAPKGVITATERRTTHKESREAIVRYLLKLAENA